MKKAITPILTGIFALGIVFGASGCKKPEAPPMNLWVFNFHILE